VPLSSARRRKRRSAVTEFFVQIFAAAGVVTGLLWSLERPAPPPTAACKQAAADSIGKCMGETMFASLMPHVVAMGVGMLVGSLIGLLIGRLLFGPKPAGAHTGRAVGRTTRSLARAKGKQAPVASADGRWIQARYAGSCADCGSPIGIGDRVLHRPKHTLCGGCGVIAGRPASAAN
jgi:hypothetical protein